MLLGFGLVLRAVLEAAVASQPYILCVLINSTQDLCGDAEQEVCGAQARLG